MPRNAKKLSRFLSISIGIDRRYPIIDWYPIDESKTTLARIDLNRPNLIASLARTILPSSLEDLARFGGAIVNCYDVDAFSCFGGAFAWVGLSLVKYVTYKNPQ